MKAIIVGGGIGGLTTTLMLRARGIGCELFEQSDTIRELGVGINTLPHAIRELAGLGLLQKLDDVAVRTDVLYYLNRHGQGGLCGGAGAGRGAGVSGASKCRGRLVAELKLQCFDNGGVLPLPLWDRDERSSLSRVGVRGHGLPIVRNLSPGSHLPMRSDLSHRGRGEDRPAFGTGHIRFKYQTARAQMIATPSLRANRFARMRAR
jgi:hypothetical protein